MVELALEQADGSVSRFQTAVFPEAHALAAGNSVYLERLLKFLLWSRGGYRVNFAGPKTLADHLPAHYQHTSTRIFDARMMGERIYERPFALVPCAAEELPAARAQAASGRDGG